MRTGASLAGRWPDGGVSPQTVRDSIQGNAMETPTPRRNVRRFSECWGMVIDSGGLGLFFGFAVHPTDPDKLGAGDNGFNGALNPGLSGRELALQIAQQGLVRQDHAATQ